MISLKEKGMLLDKKAQELKARNWDASRSTEGRVFKMEASFGHGSVVYSMPTEAPSFSVKGELDYFEQDDKTEAEKAVKDWITENYPTAYHLTAMTSRKRPLTLMVTYTHADKDATDEGKAQVAADIMAIIDYFTEVFESVDRHYLDGSLLMNNTASAAKVSEAAPAHEETVATAAVSASEEQPEKKEEVKSEKAEEVKSEMAEEVKSETASSNSGITKTVKGLFADLERYEADLAARESKLIQKEEQIYQEGSKRLNVLRAEFEKEKEQFMRQKAKERQELASTMAAVKAIEAGNYSLGQELQEKTDELNQREALIDKREALLNKEKADFDANSKFGLDDIKEIIRENSTSVPASAPDNDAMLALIQQTTNAFTSINNTLLQLTNAVIARPTSFIESPYVQVVEKEEESEKMIALAENTKDVEALNETRASLISEKENFETLCDIIRTSFRGIPFPSSDVLRRMIEDEQYESLEQMFVTAYESPERSEMEDDAEPDYLSAFSSACKEINAVVRNSFKEEFDEVEMIHIANVEKKALRIMFDEAEGIVSIDKSCNAKKLLKNSMLREKNTTKTPEAVKLANWCIDSHGLVVKLILDKHPADIENAEKVFKAYLADAITVVMALK